MIERNTLEMVARKIGQPLVALPPSWDPCLVGWTASAGPVLAVYDYDLGRITHSPKVGEFDDILLDALRGARVGDLVPLIIHTRNHD